MATDDVYDPRSIVTPDAFEIDRALLGVPLAAPTRRLGAMAIDLAIVGVLTAILSSVQLVVWGGIALALLWLALKRAKRTRSQATGVLMRASAGCLGVFILVVVLGVWALSGREGSKRDAAIGDVIERGAQLAPELRREIVNTDYSGADAPEEDSTSTGEVRGVAEMSDAQVMTALASDPAGATADADRTAALRARATRIVAGDTLDELGAQMADLESQLEEGREARRDAEEQVDESSPAAFGGLFRDIAKSAGSAFGLWSVYFTVLLTVLKGQTIGKRLMRVRVLRLDGEPIGWWSAFERVGGYVAGIATGLLGFAQIFWDPNRQCIHDKIVGTVVVIDGAERMAWEAAWGGRTKS